MALNRKSAARLSARNIIGLVVLSLIPGGIFSQQFDEIVNDSEKAVSESEPKIEKSNQKIKEVEATGTFTPDGGAQPAAASAPAPVSGGSYDETDNGGSAGSPPPSGGGQGVLFNTGKELFANVNTVFSLGSADEESQIQYTEYKIDDNQYQKYTDGFKLPTAGEHTIAYRSVDKAGNKENDQIIKVTVDATAPKAYLTPSGKPIIRNSKRYVPASYSFEIKATDKESGVKKIQVAIDGGSWMDYTGPIKLETHGPHKIAYNAVDNVDNTSQESAYDFIIDAEKPTVGFKVLSANNPGDGTIYGNGKTQVVLEASDADSGVAAIKYSIDGTDFATYGAPLTFNQTKEYAIKAKAVDAAGNESEEAGINLKIDLNPPKTTLSTQSANNSGN